MVVVGVIFSHYFSILIDGYFFCFAGEGGGVKEHKTSFHALRSILRNEGVTGIYAGSVYDSIIRLL